MKISHVNMLLLWILDSVILLVQFPYSIYFSSIISISFHYSTYFSSVFSISFPYSTYFSSGWIMIRYGKYRRNVSGIVKR
jgi:hypothetical protein